MVKVSTIQWIFNVDKESDISKCEELVRALNETCVEYAYKVCNGSVVITKVITDSEV